jgi:sn-glycerol 3-phosphate transport system permease protein
MVENRPFGNILPHLILWIGIAIVAFPVYLAFVGSTHEPSIIANGQMPLTPGGKFWKTTTARSSSARARPRASRSAACCSTRS